MAQAFNEMQQLGLDATAVALLAQRAENRFVGCQCGIMDQLVSACGEPGHVLLIDCRTLAALPVPLPDDLAVMIVHLRVARGLVDSAYNERRRQCEVAACHYGVPALRDLELAQLLSGAQGLDQTVLRRARHVVPENQRTLNAADALAAGDQPNIDILEARDGTAGRSYWHLQPESKRVRGRQHVLRNALNLSVTVSDWVLTAAFWRRTSAPAGS